MDEGRIFINYRRGDSQGSAGRLFDRFLLHFVRNRIFMDVDAIEPGVDFVASLDKQVAHCTAFIAVIGPGWLSARNSAGQRRLDDPSDYVRIEIEAALKRDIRVIPVLVDGASMPQPSELPASLEALSRRNAVEIAHHRFATDCDELAAAIKRALGVAAPPEGATGIATPTASQPIMPPEPDATAPTALPLAQSLIGQTSAQDSTPATRSLPDIVFSFRGRISRKQFVLGVLVVVTVLFAFVIPVTILTDQLSSGFDEQTQPAAKALADVLENRIMTVVSIIALWPSWALILKRLHDIGQGWPTLLVVAALDVASTVLDLFDQDDLSNQLMLVYLGIVFMLTVIRGTQGPNKYGPDPLHPASSP